MSKQVVGSKVRLVDITMVGVFAAVTYLGVQLFRIPISFTPGVPFVHFGNIFLLLGALLLGPKKGAIAGPLGFAIFDVLNGYLQVLPKVVIVAVLMCWAAAKLFDRLRTGMGQTAAILISCGAGFLISLAGDFLYELVMLMLSGSGFAAAAWVAFTALFATAFNAVFALIVLPILYPIVKKAMVQARANVH